jgi:hypothetical protein
VPVPAPTCSFAQIRNAARVVGVKDDEAAFVTYADGRGPDGSGHNGPEWLVSAFDRGRARIDASSCQPAEGERLLPAALPIGSIPGGPAEVDPIATLPLARTQSGLGPDAVLLEIDARGLGSNGRVDLTSREAGIDYTFAEPPSSTRRRWRVTHLTKDGMPVISTDQDQLPIPSRLSGAVTPPSCTLAFVYTTLGDIADGARVRFLYAADPISGEAGEFRIEAASIGLHRTISDAECAAWERLRVKSVKGSRRQR